MTSETKRERFLVEEKGKRIEEVGTVKREEDGIDNGIWFWNVEEEI
jgi:hypothetical protein